MNSSGANDNGTPSCAAVVTLTEGTEFCSQFHSIATIYFYCVYLKRYFRNPYPTLVFLAVKSLKLAHFYNKMHDGYGYGLMTKML